MRLFLAIDLSPEIKESVWNQLEPLRRKYPDFSWVNKENYHITVHFIGEGHESKPIMKKVKDVLYDQEGFRLYSTGLDLFMNHKITFFLGFRRDKVLEELAAKVKSVFGAVDERFVPHLTVARYRIPSKQQYFVIRKMLEKQAVDIEIDVKKIGMFQTILEGKRPVYEQLGSIKLL